MRKCKSKRGDKGHDIISAEQKKSSELPSHYSNSSSFSLSTATVFPRPLRLLPGRFLRAFLCQIRICLERVAFRRGNTFISILRQVEANGTIARAVVANECVRIASEKSSYKKSPPKTYEVCLQRDLHARFKIS